MAGEAAPSRTASTPVANRGAAARCGHPAQQTREAKRTGEHHPAETAVEWGLLLSKRGSRNPCKRGEHRLHPAQQMPQRSGVAAPAGQVEAALHQHIRLANSAAMGKITYR